MIGVVIAILVRTGSIGKALSFVFKYFLYPIIFGVIGFLVLNVLGLFIGFILGLILAFRSGSKSMKGQ